MKVVGTRRYYRTTDVPAILEDYDRLLATAWELRPTRRLTRRGVFRFRTFEEASAWMSREMVSTVALHESTTSPESAPPSTTPEPATS